MNPLKRFLFLFYKTVASISFELMDVCNLIKLCSPQSGSRTIPEKLYKNQLRIVEGLKKK